MTKKQLIQSAVKITYKILINFYGIMASYMNHPIVGQYTLTKENIHGSAINIVSPYFYGKNKQSNGVSKMSEAPRFFRLWR